MIRVTQSWDDGVTDDVRLIELLHKYKAKATFNLIPGSYTAERKTSHWHYQDTKEVFMLARPELPALYRDFEVASHSLTHPNLAKLPSDKLAHELLESRKQLEDLFQRPIRGFAYPYGSYNIVVKEAIRRQGYVYARTAIPGPEYATATNPTPVNVPSVYPPADPMEFGTTTHQLNPRFWQEFANTKAHGGVFHFWGHSYEFLTEKMWQAFEAKLARLSADPAVVWMTNLDLFTPAAEYNISIQPDSLV
ncbi:MAG: polysaccharide deacetylase family protein [Verrucomicrobiota bacterium]